MKDFKHLENANRKPENTRAWNLVHYHVCHTNLLRRRVSQNSTYSSRWHMVVQNMKGFIHIEKREKITGKQSSMKPCALSCLSHESASETREPLAKFYILITSHIHHSSKYQKVGIFSSFQKRLAAQRLLTGWPPVANQASQPLSCPSRYCSRLSAHRLLSRTRHAVLLLVWRPGPSPDRW